jgi:threonine aldolase
MLASAPHAAHRSALRHGRRGSLLSQLPGARLQFPVETNLLFVAFEGRSAADLCARFLEVGVLCDPEGSRPELVWFVTHLDVSAADIEEAARRVAGVVGA